MRKKVFGVLTLLCLFVVCFSLTACKGKYDSMKFRVWYAFSEDAQTWLDGTNGIDVCYGEEEGLLPKDASTGWAKIYIKIDVEKVKSKYLDKIFVSSSTSSNTNFNGATVKRNQVFAIEIKDMVSLTLTAIETNSQKSCSFALNASEPLDRIEANYSVKPAIAIGSTASSLNLAQFKNSAIEFYPLNKTNQTAVGFEISRVGGFAKTEGQTNQFEGTNNFAGVMIDGDNLIVDPSQFNLANNRYAVEVKVTSQFDSSKFCLIYVYVVLDVGNTPAVKYYNEGVENLPISANSIKLYHGTEYSNATLIVDFEDNNSMYVQGLLTSDGVIAYKPNLYVGGRDVAVDLNSQTQQETLDYGLLFGKGAVENVFTITATTANLASSGVDVEFRLEFEGLNFGGQTLTANSTTINIKKGQLTNSVRVKGENLDWQQGGTFNIYSTNGKTNAVELLVSATPSVDANQKIFIEEQSNNLTISPATNSSNGQNYIYTDRTIRINFAANDITGSGRIVLSARTNPEIFQGLAQEEQTVKITLNFVKVITAHGFAIFKDADANQQLEAGQDLIVGVGANNAFYLRAYYSNGEFTTESAKSIILNSNSDSVKFAVNQLITRQFSLEQIAQNGFGVEGDGVFAGDNFVQYCITLAPISSTNKAVVTIGSGANTLNLNKTFNVQPVVLSNGEFDLATPTSNEAVRVQVENGHINYALEFNKTAIFSLVGRAVGAADLTSDVVKNIAIENYDNAQLENENFANSAVDVLKISSTNLRTKANSTQGKTRVVKISVSYYTFTTNGNFGYVDEATTTITAEFAVFVPIDHFEITPTLKTLTYLNSNITSAGDYSNYTTAEINYKAVSSYIGFEPTSQVHFLTDSGDVVRNPSKINFSFSPSIAKTPIVLTHIVGANSSAIETTLEFENLQGKIKVELTGQTALSNLKLTFTPMIFDTVREGAEQSAIINFQGCAAADHVQISGNSIVNKGEDSNYVSISYLDVLTKSFNAQAVYKQEDSNKLKLGLLDFELRKVDDGVVGVALSKQEVEELGINVEIENGTVTVSVKNNSKNGGVYKLTIFAPDSFNVNYQAGVNEQYFAQNHVFLEISDGSEASPFVLYTAEDFKKLEADDSTVNGKKYYVLAEDLTIEGDNVIKNEFFGELSGQYSFLDSNNNVYSITHTIKVVLSVATFDNVNNYIGLFQKLGASAVVKNLNLDVVFDLNNVQTSNVDVYVGGLAGLNNGTIMDVDVNLVYNSQISLQNFGLDNSHNIYFGGLVGANAGSINLINSAVASNGVTVFAKSTTNNNIGLVAGLNSNTITGNYLGKSSLDAVDYTIVSNLVVEAATNANINVGAVAGSTTGLSLIQDVIAGGKIELRNSNSVGGANSSLGGIVGNAVADGATSAKGVHSCAVLGLDLINNLENGIAAGIVGTAVNTDVYDVRVMATYVKFFNDLVCFGKISANTAAGVVGQATNGNIENASVESFVESYNNEPFFMLDGATIFGLTNATSNQTKIKSSFVKANVSGTTFNPTSSNAQETGSYFLGKVQNFNGTTTNINATTTFVAIYTNTNLYYKNGSSLTEYQADDFDAFVKNTLIAGASFDADNVVTVGGVKFKLDSSKNVINLGEPNYYFPFIIDESGNPQMIEYPENIEAAFNQEYSIKINSKLVGDGQFVVEINEIEQNIAQILFVNYYEFEDQSKPNTTYNTHKLVNTNGQENPNGLIDLSVFPQNTQGGIRFEIVNIFGFNFARIDGNNIVFTGVSGSLPIVVRAYSTFNPSVSSYVLFFTQNGITNLQISSTSAVVNNASNQTADYELITYTNSAPIILNFEANNLFEGQRFKTLFDNANFDLNNIEIGYDESTNDGFENGIVNLAPTSSKTAMKLSVEGEFEGYYYEKEITFTLYLNIKDYINNQGFTIAEENERLQLKQVVLRVQVFKSTEKIETSIYQKTFDSETPVTFDINLITGFVREDDDNQALNIDNIVVNNNTIRFVERNADGKEDKDSLILTFNKDEQNSTALEQLLAAAANGEADFGIANLFDVSVRYRYYFVNEVRRGYVYSIELVLKEGDRFRYLTQDVNLSLTINSTTNPNPSLDKLKDLSPKIELTITPTQFKSARIYNYTATDMEAGGTNIISCNSVDTSLISPAPNSYGSILTIHLQPTYANIISATIASNRVNVPTVANGVYLIFTQVEPIEVDGNVIYQTVVMNTSENGELTINKNYIKDGVAYIHAMVSDSFAGYSAVLTATLKVDVAGADGNRQITVQKQLVTDYLPGVYLSFDKNAQTDNAGKEFFIEENTFNNPVAITLYGYEFKNNPDIVFEWSLDNNPLYSYYQQGNTQDRTKIVSNAGGQTYSIGDFVDHSDFKDFSTLVANQDGSYTFSFNIRVLTGLPASFKMIASLRFTDENSDTKELIFHPIKYLLRSATLSEINNGVLNLRINSHSRLDFEFETNNEYYDNSLEIYEDILSNITINQLKHAFSFTGKFDGYFDGTTNNAFEVKNGQVTAGSKTYEYIYLVGLAETEFDVRFRLNYDYEFDNSTGLYKIKFGLEQNFTGSRTIEFSFKLDINAGTTEDAPIALFKDDFVEKITTHAGADFILMDDVDLFDFTPITTNIASLDGNNKVIRIHSFSVATDRTEYGLFAHIGSFESGGQTKSTILKNIIVDYSNLEFLNLARNTATDFVFGGLVATVSEGGLVYNCDVMNVFDRESSSNGAKTVNILLDDFEGANITFGGLVGINNGNITNSRVGRMSYTKINFEVDGDTIRESSSTIPAYPITFVLGNSNADATSSTANAFVGVAGGFVGTNNGIVASCYVANTGLTNYSARADETNMTAGFVAQNNGTIKFSYVKALESTITSGSAGTAVLRSTGVRISGATNGNVAGFVYTNSSVISNCFANTELYTDSAFLAGFVYNNTEAGQISESYSACTLNRKDNENSSAEQPFVGVNANNTLLSFGEITNCFYLEETGSVFTRIDEDGKDQAVGLDGDNFADPNTLTNFVFVQSLDREVRSQGVWSYYTIDTNAQHILPELTSANIVAHSYRRLVGETDGVYYYENSPQFRLGSANNPNIIRNPVEFNYVLTGRTGNDDLTTDNSNFVGYVRLINNIDFNNIAILTRSNFSLGDKVGNALTSFDGNGMHIDNIYLDVLKMMQDDNVDHYDKVGLFAEINKAYVKNVDLNYATIEYAEQNPTIPIKYSGGLAGTIDNSALININLVGNNTTIAGNNFVGGLAGIITGKSIIFGITSNLGAISDSSANANLYYSEQDFETMRNQDAIAGATNYEDYLNTLSFAGGVAGVLDLSSREFVTYNISNVSVFGDQMSAREGGNIVANYAGGIAGYASADTVALKLRFDVGANTSIFGVQAAGGLYGVGIGRERQNVSLTASQVSAKEDVQYGYDTNYGSYIINLANGNEASLLDASIGNRKLLTTEGYAGGLVGISIAQSVESCYAKSSVNLAQTFGGAIGLSVGTTLTHVYAVPYVNLKNTLIQKVGGLFGVAYSSSNEATSYKPYTTFAKSVLNVQSKHSDALYTFSTLIIDNNDLTEILNGNVEEDGQVVKIFDNGQRVKFIDYLAAEYEEDGVCHLYSNSVKINNGNLAVYVGRVENYAKNSELEFADAVTYTNGEAIDLHELMDVQNDVDQPVLFKNVFGDWPPKYWLLDNTRYFPLLLKKEALNYIIIDEQSDFDILLEHPDLNYKIVKDIDMAGWNETHKSNWIFDVEFTGTLISEVDEGKNTLPKVYNLHVNTVTNNASAGLFRATKTATIRDIDWIWTYSTDTSKAAINIEATPNITVIGGISCDDFASKLTNLNVYVGSYNSGIFTPLDVPFINNINTNGKETTRITGFGGIASYSESSSIENCSFNAKINAFVSMENLLPGEEVVGSTDIYFGGLIGRAKKADSLENMGAGYQNRSILMSSTVGYANDANKQFNIKLGEYSNAYIGGAVGFAQKTAINGVSVGNNQNNIGNDRIIFNIELTNKSFTYFGGLIGQEEDSSISDCEILTDATFNTTKSPTDTVNNGSLYAAGMVGKIAQTIASTANGIVNVNVNANMKFGTVSMQTAYISTGVAEVVSAGMVEITQSLFSGVVTTENTLQNEEEGAFKDFYIENIYAGGVVAHQTEANGIVRLQEVYTNADLTLGFNNKINSETEVAPKSTSAIYVGGLVGKADGTVVVLACMTTGKIVPVTGSFEDDLAKDYQICFGGFVAKANKVDFENSISTSSIFADSINPSSIKDLKAHAILGDIESTDDDRIICTNVYYSSDISLFPEDLCTDATNLSANVLTHTSEWQSALVSSGYWTAIDNSMPYISNGNVARMLRANKIVETSLNRITGYFAGTSTNPELLDANQIGTLKDAKEFKYYILETNTVEGSNTIQLSNIDLFGVIIGGEMEYNLSTFLNSRPEVEIGGGESEGGSEETNPGGETEQGGEDANPDENADYENYISGDKGIVGKILKHSAISNLHVRVLSANDIYMVGTLSNGIIAGNNLGVIFNCSVQGTDLRLHTQQEAPIVNNPTQGEPGTGEATPEEPTPAPSTPAAPTIVQSYAGLIAGINNGLLAYSYSSAEVVDLDGELGGIANTNYNKMLSCYFTGYLGNNTANQAAGIVIDNAVNAEENTTPYIYNCYMAGVVKTLDLSDNNEGPFAVHLGNGTNFYGSNNYIDINTVGKEIKRATSGTDAHIPETVHLQTINVEYLMGNVKDEKPVLDGRWSTSVKTIKLGALNKYYVDLASPVYGYNYFYPVYNFEKRGFNGTAILANYQLYTGTGTNSDVVDMYNLYSSTHDEDINGVYTGSNLYNHAVKVPHLGVLKAIQGLSTTIVPTPEDFSPYKVVHPNLNYVLIYDIDGKFGEANSTGYVWQAVGSQQRDDEWLTQDAHFIGLFVSNRYYNFMPIEVQDDDKFKEDNKCLCIVQNLKNQGLFANVLDAFFGYIKLGSMQDLNNSGALAVNTTKASSSSLGNIIYVNRLYFLKNASIAGLRNSAAGSYVAGMFGQINGSEVKITNSGYPFVEDEIGSVTIQDANYMGLIVGSMLSGNIQFTGANNLRVNFIGSNPSVEYIAGGIVGSLKEGSVFGGYSMENEEVGTQIHITQTRQDEDFVGVKVGGVVGYAYGDVGLSTNNVVDNLYVRFPESYTAVGFGGLLYKSTNAILSFTNCGMSSDVEESNFELTLLGQKNYFGYIVAEMEASESDSSSSIKVHNFDIGETTSVEVILKEKDKVQDDTFKTTDRAFGGLVGYMNGGSLAFSSKENFKATLSARSVNIGGIVGYFNNGKIALDPKFWNNDTDQKEYFINLSGYYNVGGAIGYFAGDITTIISNAFVSANGTPTDGTPWNFFKSAKPFAEISTFKKAPKEDLEKPFFNWGGLIGSFISNAMIDVTNRNSIVIGTIFNGASANGAQDVLTNSPIIKNIGGIAGKATNADDNGLSVSKLNNYGEIQLNNQTGENDTAINCIEIDAIDKEPYIIKFSANAKLTQKDIENHNSFTTINVGGIFGLAENVEYNSISNYNSVFGYQNVGGLFGAACGVVCSALGESQTSYVQCYTEGSKPHPTNIVGVVNVGGAIGAIYGTKISQIRRINILSPVKVFGNFNVGGFAGFVQGGTIENIEMFNSNTAEEETITVKGVYFATMNFVMVTVEEEDGNPLNENPNYPAYFFPTNIGGFIGCVEVGTGVEIHITNNSIKDVLVTTSLEGVLDKDVASPGSDKKQNPTFNDLTVLSTVSNAVLLNSSVEQPLNLITLVEINKEDATLDNLGKIAKANLQDFNNATTGIGGFIGSTSARAVLNDDGNELLLNKMSNVVVDASLGINVGGIYGNYDANKTIQLGDANAVVHSVRTPTLLSDVKVTGAYFVGGIAGNIYSSNGATEAISFSNRIYKTDMDNYKNSIASGDVTPTIYIQTGKNNFGMYLGGYFGRLKGNATGMIMEKGDADDYVKIYMDNTNSFYSGGLIGRLEGNLIGTTESNVVDTMNSFTYYDKEDTNKENPKTEAHSASGSFGLINTTKQGNDITYDLIDLTNPQAMENFGGLVGMLKVPANSNPDRATQVYGWHQYAFTVNTIENSAYADGDTVYDYEDGVNQTQVNLIAQAQYINQNKFEISYSRGGQSYSATPQEFEDFDFTNPQDALNKLNEAINKFLKPSAKDCYWFNVNANNPLNPDATNGWARDYTMFKVMQRNIPQTQNNGAEWDSLAVLYDASRITYVAALSNTIRDIIANQPALSSALIIKLLSQKYDNINNKDITLLEHYGAEEVKINEYGLIDGFKISYENFKNLFGHIFYTIYENSTGTPILYSRIGIATPYKDDAGQYTNEQPHSQLTAVYLRDGNDIISGAKLKEYIPTNYPGVYSGYLFVPMSDNSSLNYTYLDWAQTNLTRTAVNIKYGDVSTNNYKLINANFSNIQWVEDAQPEGLKDLRVNITNNGSSVGQAYVSSYLIMQVKDTKRYHALETTNADNEGDDIYFLFATLFENSTLGYSNDYLPQDGSVLNAAGLLTKDANVKTSDDDIKREPTLWEKFVNSWWGQLIIFLVAALVAFIAGVVAIIATAINPILAGFIAGLLPYLIAALTTVFTEVFASKLVGIENLAQQSVVADQIALATYLQRRDLSYGLIGDTYDREVYYVNIGDKENPQYKMQPLPDSNKTLNGDLYTYYSTTRPINFFSNFYSLYKIGEDELQSADKDAVITDKTDENNKTIYEYNGKNYDAMARTFIFVNGAYYINTVALNQTTEPVQMNFPEKNFNDTQKYFTNGYYYVQGAYGQNKENDEIGYYLNEAAASLTDNNLYLNDDYIKNKLGPSSNYNGITEQQFKSATSMDFKVKKEKTLFVPADMLGDSLYIDGTGFNIINNEINNKSDIYAKSDSDNDPTMFDKLYDHYGYIKGAYYAAAGSPLSYGAWERDVITEQIIPPKKGTNLEKYATFKYIGYSYNGKRTFTIDSGVDEGTFRELKSGVDYVTISLTFTRHAFATDDNGNIQYKQQKENGNPVFDEDGNPVYEVDANGKRVPLMEDTGTGTIYLYFAIDLSGKEETSGSDLSGENSITANKRASLEETAWNTYTYTTDADGNEVPTLPNYDGEGFADGLLDEEYTALKNAFNLKLYPYSFENPYSDTINDISNDKNVKDTHVYVNSAMYNSVGLTGLTYDVTYFYWDGGYTAFNQGSYEDRGEDNERHEHVLSDDGFGYVYTPKLEVKVSNGNDGKVVVSGDGNVLSQKVVLYEANGSPVKNRNNFYTLGDLIATEIVYNDNKKDNKFAIKHNSNEYEDSLFNYYTVKTEDSTAEGQQQTEPSTFTQLCNIMCLKITEQTANSATVQILSRDGSYIVQDGLLFRSWLVDPDANYNRNKYLMNKELEIYTRYKFTAGYVAKDRELLETTFNESQNLFETGEWVYGGNGKYLYYLFSKDENSSNENAYNSKPNKKDTWHELKTRLTESLVVTLGGGNTIRKGILNGVINETTSGSFTAK